MKKKKLFIYSDDTLHLHHTLTLEPATDDLTFKSHSHNMVEIYYFLRGNARFVVEGNIFPLERGNILVMASGQTHHLLLIDTVAVPREYALLSEQIYEGANLFVLENREQIWFEESFLMITKSPEDMKKNLIFSFASMIFGMLLNKLSPAIDQRIEDDIIKKTINYINKNLSGELSLDIIARALYMSRVSLNRKFRKIMGCTVWEYVIRRRIYSARQQLFLGRSITDAYQKSGFNDYSSFFRAYKKTVGTSPSEDIKKSQG